MFCGREKHVTGIGTEGSVRSEAVNNAFDFGFWHSLASAALGGCTLDQFVVAH